MVATRAKRGASSVDALAAFTPPRKKIHPSQRCGWISSGDDEDFVLDSSQTWQLAAGNAPAIALTELLLLNDGDRELYKWNLGNGEWCLVEYANYGKKYAGSDVGRLARMLEAVEEQGWVPGVRGKLLVLAPNQAFEPKVLPRLEELGVVVQRACPKIMLLGSGAGCLFCSCRPCENTKNDWLRALANCEALED